MPAATFTISQMESRDLYRINMVNLDEFTETYAISFYVQYLTGVLPHVFVKAEDNLGNIVGYLMGKLEGKGDQYHGHITAVTVAPFYRRQGVATALMNHFENICIENECRFIDLYVRVSNKVAVDMYTHKGYVVYQQVLGYYGGDDEEDAYDMHRALPADKDRKSMIPRPRPITVQELFANTD